MTTNSKILFENIVKNLSIILILYLLYPWIAAHARTIPNHVHGEVLTILGLLLAGAVAGTFSVTYEKTNMDSVWDRYFVHATTFLLILGIGLLLEITGWVLAYLGGLGSWKDPIAVAGIAIFLAIMLYDTWDILRWIHANREIST